MSLIAPPARQFASDQGHWYALDGTPAYEQPNASKPGEMRPTTLRDAKKLNLVPSTTTVLKSIASPGLERWKLQQVLHSALTLPKILGENETAYSERVMADSREQVIKAAERGTSIHTSIENMLGGVRPHDPKHDKHCANFLTEMAKLGLDLAPRRTEHSFASPIGFGGRVDLWGDGPEFVLDCKTKEAITEDTKPYLEHALQLVSYGKGLGLESPRLISCFVGDKDATVLMHEWPKADHPKYWEMFKSILRFYRLRAGLEEP